MICRIWLWWWWQYDFDGGQAPIEEDDKLLLWYDDDNNDGDYGANKDGKPIEEDDKLLASCSNLRVWMGDGSTAKFGKADGTTNEYGSYKKILLNVGSYFLTHIGSPSSSLSPYSATRNLGIVLVKQRQQWNLSDNHQEL